jgi:AcrR family transcriptional regulator
MRAFLALAAERGIEATTTRGVADRAGVNEVTIFRTFADKEGLLRAAIERFDPTSGLAEYPLDIDPSSPESVSEGLIRVLRFMRSRLAERHELVEFGLAESWRYPELSQQVKQWPLAGRRLVERALEQGRSQLRPETDVKAAALTLIGFVFLTSVWRMRGWIDLDPEAWNQMLEAAVRPLLKWEGS